MAPAFNCVTADALSTTEKSISSSQPPLRVVGGTWVGASVACGALVAAAGGGADVAVTLGPQAVSSMLRATTTPTTNIKRFCSILCSPPERTSGWGSLMEQY